MTEFVPGEEGRNSRHQHASNLKIGHLTSGLPGHTSDMFCQPGWSCLKFALKKTFGPAGQRLARGLLHVSAAACHFMYSCGPSNLGIGGEASLGGPHFNIMMGPDSGASLPPPPHDAAARSISSCSVYKCSIRVRCTQTFGTLRRLASSPAACRHPEWQHWQC
jgi:hypothetical protein